MRFIWYDKHTSLLVVRAAERMSRPWSKREGRDSLPAKQAESSQGPEINHGKLLLVYFMEPSRP